MQYWQDMPWFLFSDLVGFPQYADGTTREIIHKYGEQPKGGANLLFLWFKFMKTPGHYLEKNGFTVEKDINCKVKLAKFSFP